VYYLSHRIKVTAGKQKGDNIALRIFGYIVLAALVSSVSSGYAQQFDSQVALPGGSYRIDQPSSMAASPGGERIAVNDLNTNRILVIDLYGRSLWVAGDQIRLDQPGALCFESEARILFVPAGQLLVLAVTEENPSRVDTLKDLSGELKHWRGVDQILSAPNSGGHLLLNKAAGEVAAYDSNWEFKDILIRHGSGKGQILAPSSLALTLSGKMVVADRKNSPVQYFASDGNFLMYGGWNQPSQERGWEAAAVAVDTRDFVWVADETKAQYRLFDQSGTLVSTVPFLNPAVRPVAMVGTVDNRMAILEQTGSLLFYTLQ
jgi:DNA-binding beta-propeller fold protein YncE